MIRTRQDITALIARHRFALAILATIAIGILMTIISLSLYISSGTIQLDLSRPGYEAVRKEINQDKKKDFANTGPVNSSVMAEFQSQFDAERKDLNSFGQFKDKALDDESLDISGPTETQSAPGP